MAASGLTLEAVKEFIIQNGGKVTNHELVTKFKSDLNDQNLKAKNRENFKDFVNQLATIKVDEKGEKVLVLKKKFRPEFSLSTVSIDSKHDNTRAMSEPPTPPKQPSQAGFDEADGGGMSKVRSESNISGAPSSDSSMKESLSMGTLSVSSIASAASTSSAISQSSLDSQPSAVSSVEDDVNASIISVKDRAKHLNRMETESALQKAEEKSLHSRKKDFRSRDREGNDDDDSHSSGSGFVSIEPEERDWLVVISSGEYHPIHKLLSKNPELVHVKDFTNGYNAIHWAAKHGKTDILKLVASKCLTSDLNKRTHGGYTPLHLASMQGHEEIIELLVKVYKADTNIRDYSGKKAKQYLSNSASSKAQQMLLSHKLGASMASTRSLDDAFHRGNTSRGSTRAKAISSLIQTTSVGMRKAMLRSSWAGSSENVAGERTRGMRSRSPSVTPPGSAGPSPSLHRKNMDQERDMMPPPSAPVRKSKKYGLSSSKESLDDEALHGMSVSRSESEPSLGRAGNQTYV